MVEHPALSDLCFTPQTRGENGEPGKSEQGTTPIHLISQAELQDGLHDLGQDQQTWLKRQSFSATPGQWAWLDGGLNGRSAPSIVVGTDHQENFLTLGSLAHNLPEGDYHLESHVTDLQLLGWALGAYRFNRYKAASRLPARLVIPDVNQQSTIRHMADAVALSRDLINTPAADMTPDHLAAEAQALAEEFDAQCHITRAEALLDIDCGAIHAVGRAATTPPCLIDLTWGDPAHPEIVLVGKGITFDSGGLNLKPASGIRWMKKDMGGAAIALGLAGLVMSEALPVHLRLLIPAAENAIAGNAFRPGDVLHTHKGLTVEIDNTDAEGRLVLCDALSIACERQPAALFDFATLTGSARSAVGTELAAMFCNNDTMAQALYEHGQSQADPVWRMPLHPGYEYMIDSNVADMVNSAASPYAGSITAALFLQRFVKDTQWAHFDLMAFNNRARPGHPEGGEAMALRTVFAYLAKRFPQCIT